MICTRSDSPEMKLLICKVARRWRRLRGALWSELCKGQAAASLLSPPGEKLGAQRRGWDLCLFRRGIQRHEPQKPLPAPAFRTPACWRVFLPGPGSSACTGLLCGWGHLPSLHQWRPVSPSSQAPATTSSRGGWQMGWPLWGSLAPMIPKVCGLADGGWGTHLQERASVGIVLHGAALC